MFYLMATLSQKSSSLNMSAYIHT